MSISGLPTVLLTIGRTGALQLPANFVDRPEMFQNITRVLAIDTFYDSMDKETFGIVLVQTESGATGGEWTFLSHIRAHGCHATNLVKWEAYLRNFGDAGHVNIHFPVFAKVLVSSQVARTVNQLPAYICSTDDNSEHQYGVAYGDTVTENQDVQKGKSAIRLAQIAHLSNCHS